MHNISRFVIFLNPVCLLKICKEITCLQRFWLCKVVVLMTPNLIYHDIHLENTILVTMHPVVLTMHHASPTKIISSQLSSWKKFKGIPELQNAWIINKRAWILWKGLCFVFIVLKAVIEEEKQDWSISQCTCVHAIICHKHPDILTFNTC